MPQDASSVRSPTLLTDTSASSRATTTSSETTFENNSTTNKHFIIFTSDSDSAHFIPHIPLSLKIHLSLLNSCVIFALFHPCLLATWPKPHQKSPYKTITNTRNCRQGLSSSPIDPKFRPDAPGRKRHGWFKFGRNPPSGCGDTVESVSPE